MLRPRFEAETSTGISGWGEQRAVGKIRIAIVGVGNCASSLIEGIHYYAGQGPRETAEPADVEGQAGARR